MPEELYTIEEAAEYFKVSTKTIRNLMRDGIITGFRIGGTGNWRFTQQDLLDAQERMRKRTDTDGEHKAVKSPKNDEDRELVACGN